MWPGWGSRGFFPPSLLHLPEHLLLYVKRARFSLLELTYKRGKSFDELLKAYSNDKRLVMTQLSVQTELEN